MTQIAENWSRVSGQIEEWIVPAEAPEPVTLTVRVESVRDIPREQGAAYRNMLKGHEGRSLRILVPASAASRLNLGVGEHVQLDVRRGRSPDLVFARPEPFEVSE